MALLTIAIPTYNRSEQIQKQVRLLLPQLNDQVRLVVYDNCSPKIVLELFSASELSYFQVIRRPHNIGGDANIADAICTASTRWVWPLSDDDIVLPDAVQRVLGAIERHSDVAFINMQTKIEGVFQGFESYVKMLDNIDTYGDSFWVSKCIYNIELLSGNIRDYYSHLSSMIGQLIFVLKYLEGNDTGKVYSSKELILADLPAGDWKYCDYIVSTSSNFDAFGRDKRSLLNKTLFKAMTYTYLVMITTMYGKGYDRKQLRYLTRLILFRYGLFRSCRMFPGKLVRMKIHKWGLIEPLRAAKNFLKR